MKFVSAFKIAFFIGIGLIALTLRVIHYLMCFIGEFPRFVEFGYSASVIFLLFLSILLEDRLSALVIVDIGLFLINVFFFIHLIYWGHPISWIFIGLPGQDF